PWCVAGVRATAAAMWADVEHVESAFRGDGGLHWGHHDHRLYSGVERVFAPGYRHGLIPQWIPALDGVEAKLHAGGRVADLGCGTGLSTVLMAQAYPEARFSGLDLHEESIETAQRRAREAGVDDRVEFVVGDAAGLVG